MLHACCAYPQHGTPLVIVAYGLTASIGFGPTLSSNEAIMIAANMMVA
jgi:hypothetical protein